MYGELQSTWDNMPTLKQMSTEQLLDRLQYISEQRDEMDFNRWERDWAAELQAVSAELNTRTIII